jgi:transposase, IS30 family
MAQGPYKHLLEGERRVIAQMRAAKKSIREIATVTGRSPSTIAREVQRNLHQNHDHAYYTYSVAHSKAMGRRSKARRHSHYSSQEWDLVDQRLRKNWSPEQTAKTLGLEGLLVICHETIYRHVYADKKAGGTLYMHLRLKCRKRRKRYRSKDSRGRLAGKVMIGERPAAIDTREAVGHWEIDTVMGKGSKSCIATLVERKTGYLLIGMLKSRTVKDLNARVIAMIKSCTVPVLSITSDNGTEFHGYKEIEQRTKTTFYFATPHHAWERGTNENTNGLIRQYLPKGTSMTWVTQQTCDKIAREINNRPRKRLVYQTPMHAIQNVA